MSNIKCAQCGLVNWSSDVTCKRCGGQLEWHQGPMLGPDSAAGGAEPLFSSVLTFLTAILVLAVAAFLSCRVFQAIDLETAKIVAAIIVFGGIALLLIAHLWLLLRIFEQSPLWGFATLCIPLAGLFAIAKFWENTKRSFIGQLLSVGIILVGSQIVP